MKPITYLRRLAENRGLKVNIVECGPGHVQIQGELLVNFYPEARTRTAYIAGTTKGIKGVSPEKALAMAFRAPPITHERDSRGKQKRAKALLLRRSVCVDGQFRCRWCEGLFDKKDLTVEHIIPLARGGLDNMNNKGLACAPCNHGRGHDMPELARTNKQCLPPPPGSAKG